MANARNNPRGLLESPSGVLLGSPACCLSRHVPRLQLPYRLLDDRALGRFAAFCLSAIPITKQVAGPHDAGQVILVRVPEPSVNLVDDMRVPSTTPSA